jgi:transposase
MSDTELLLKSEPVRRLEVFTGSGRRRTWTAEQKARIVAESHAGGETVSAVARRHGLTPQQLFGWRRKAHQEAAPGTRELAFASVMVEPPGSDVATIEIVIGAAIVRVPPGADLATLQTALCALKAMS